MSRMNTCTKQVFDFVVAAVGMIILLPFVMIIALAIKCDSPGPVLFRQTRLGRQGKPFQLYKFRKFRSDISDSGPAITSRGDRRMTRLGHFLQKSKLDELPQLWNVIRGEISLVGPRPETLRFADCFENGLQQVLDYKPGIFGPNQIFFRNEDVLFARVSDPERFYREALFVHKARLDIAYFSRASVLTDIGWILRGVFVVLFPRVADQQSAQCLAQVERWIRDHDAIGYRNSSGGPVDGSKRPMVA
jgi:lipopolysaccharide/colanic/teichoic acid biosynthesis glycosyltransferase